MPPTLDLSFTGLDEFDNKPVIESCKAKSSEVEPKADPKVDCNYRQNIMWYQKQFQNQRMVKPVWNNAEK
ncbi:hypothetical protein Tco_1084255, partial [Tanacetum coccineum]